MFQIIKKDAGSSARAGVLKLYHGEVLTPVFMPVGTNGFVKTFFPDELEKMDIEIILSNAYHLYLRPGLDVIENAGGLHCFAKWDKNILTDSGGFQLFSLSALNKITEEGIKFNSHIDGSRHFLTPEDVVRIQKIIGSDIMMILDHCTPTNTSLKDASKAVDRTTRWAKQSIEYYKENINNDRQKIFGIAQGNFYKELRAKSALEISSLPFDGFAIGGLSVGEEKKVFLDILAFTAPLLPENKPKYLMGVGTPLDILESVENGIDMFDCVFPTRTARNASAMTSLGRINLNNNQFRLDNAPLDPGCSCYVCKNFSRSFIRHMFKAKEISASRMTSFHNIFFIKKMMIDIRNAIINDNFSEFKADFISKYTSVKGGVQ